MKDKSRNYNPATARFYTLNQDGSRGVSIDQNGNRETLPFSMDGGKTIKNKSILYHEQCGNFSFPIVRIKGKALAVYPNSEVEAKFYTTFELKYPKDTLEFQGERETEEAANKLSKQIIGGGIVQEQNGKWVVFATGPNK